MRHWKPAICGALGFGAFALTVSVAMTAEKPAPNQNPAATRAADISGTGQGSSAQTGAKNPASNQNATLGGVVENTTTNVNATVSFGQWQPPLDRLTANPAGGVGNVHELAPNLVRIQAGGAVNFIIAGLHNVQVYKDGTQPENIGATPPVIGSQGGGIIDVAENRIYRGWDPIAIPNDFERDRVEVVHFAEPGKYLVICGIRNHFVNDAMYGFVEVLPEKEPLPRLPATR